jgi:arylsulfatase A-like enzyme
VGCVVGALRESGELNDTYVVFTCDHGFHLGQHRLKPGKWTPYDDDARTSLIVTGPGVPEGKMRWDLVGNHDRAQVTGLPAQRFRVPTTARSRPCSPTPLRLGAAPC